MTVIGGDGGLLKRPQRQAALTLAPGQRADLLLDLTALAAGDEVHLYSLAYPEADAGVAGMMGVMGGRGRGMMGGRLYAAERRAASRDDARAVRQERAGLPRARTALDLRCPAWARP